MLLFLKPRTLAFSARSERRAFAGLRAQALNRLVLSRTLEHRPNLNDCIAQTRCFLEVHGSRSITHIFLHGFDDPHKFIMWKFLELLS